MFDWQSFLDGQNIEYQSKGRNVSKGNLAIHCPMCGDDDPSFHMNVSLTGKGWACWREAEHRGAHPGRLIQFLLGISWQEAKQLVDGIDKRAVTEEQFASVAARFMGSESKEASFDLPDEFRPLWRNPTMTGDYIRNYIMDRGYAKRDTERLALRYRIHYAIKGEWRGRVIFPLFDEVGNVVNCTGRRINDNPLNTAVRYKTMAQDVAPKRISECLFDLAMLRKRAGGNVLVICEGPFDAMRINWIGEYLGIKATCVFTQNVSETQLHLIQLTMAEYDRTVVLFDAGATLQAFRAVTTIGHGAELARLPGGVKDPGDLSPAQTLTLCRTLIGVP